MTPQTGPRSHRILLATTNQGKIAEMKRLVEEAGISVVQPADIGARVDIDEDQDTLEGNAIKKARTLNRLTGIPCLADDTGLEVSALDGQPGVHSARYAGPDQDAARNRSKLLNEMMSSTDRSARFRTVVAFVDGELTKVFDGTCEGYILRGERGEKGFGYDAIFAPAGSDMSFAEMTIEEKNKVSHRARALGRFVEYLIGEGL